MFRLFRSVPTIYFPVMWFSLEVEATQKFVDDLRKLLSLPNVCIYAGIILILVGSLIISTVALLYLLNRQRANSLASDKVINFTPANILLPYDMPKIYPLFIGYQAGSDSFRR